MLTAPIAGTYMGVAVFQDRSNINTLSLVGGTNQLINGGIYAAAAPLTYTGGSATSQIKTLLIAKTVTFVGNTYFSGASKTGYSGGTGGPTLIQ